MCVSCFSNAGFNKIILSMKLKNKLKIFKSSQKRKGFSLIEILVSIFIFVLAIAMLTGSFSSFLKNYSNAKKIQKDVENAQYAMNLMAKTIRTSEVDPVSASASSLKTYDYSQGKCIEYQIGGNKIQASEATTSATKLSDCDWTGAITNNLTSDNSIISSDSSISATKTDSSGSPLGKVTIVLYVQSGTSTAIPIQTSVSLRQ